MQVLAVGIGGAGSRIVETIHNFENRKNETRTFFGLAVSTNPDELKSLKLIPENQKIFFPRIIIGPDGPVERGPDPHAVSEALLNRDTGETDAIIIICGLGGTSVQYISPLIETLRTSVIEPVFGLFLIPDPQREPGKREKALIDLKDLNGKLDGIFVFDNQLIVQEPGYVPKNKHISGEIAIPFFKQQGPDIFERKYEEWNYCNTEVARRISVVLRAGESVFKNEKKSGEVVVDAGDVINTIKNSKLISLCYARDRIRNQRSGISDLLSHTNTYDDDERRAARIMSLAHQALLELPSCRFNPHETEKALVIVAGPSHELSMKGYMATREWLNRLMPEAEIRGGDYPTTYSHYVAVVIIASGFPFSDIV